MSKHLHLAIIFKASNCNYGESVGNILSIKKLACEGRNYSYISRQALRYDIVRMLNEDFQFDLTPTDRDAGVLQFKEEATIENYPEIDFFGYMKTNSGKIRKAVVRLTDAVSLEPFHNDMDFANNMGLARRNDQELANDLFQSEIHKSYYSYTLTSNLDQIGADIKDNIHLPKEERARRTKALLGVLKLLYRDIRGKRENLSPLLIIGGLYSSGNPFFYNRLELIFKKEGTFIKDGMINDILNINIPPQNESVKSQTKLGVVSGEFANIDALGIDQLTIEAFFAELSKDIDNYYK